MVISDVVANLKRVEEKQTIYLLRSVVANKYLQRHPDRVKCYLIMY